jgi:FlaA1/EpsC-like NDP-sugar epimerase
MIKLSGFEVDKDIEIKVTGLRPGEKLYEELLMNEEGLTSTANKKIFIAKPSDFDFDTLKAEIEILNKLANEESTSELREYMKKIVPTFKEAM